MIFNIDERFKAITQEHNLLKKHSNNWWKKRQLRYAAKDYVDGIKQLLNIDIECIEI